MHPAAELYLDLMKRCLTNWIYGDAEVETLVPEQFSSQEMFWALAKQGIRLVRPKPFDPQLRAVGRDWPPTAHTMIGLKRLDNLQCCVEDVLAKHVAGDLMETGVWRGGASIFMRAVLKAHGISDRHVWVADSFAGLLPSCLQGDPTRVTIWVPALSVVKLWETRQVDVCDLLKLDCEGMEIPILAALGQAGLLPRVRRIVGEWHALAQLGHDADDVQAELRRILEPTHEVLSGARPGGTLGYFVAQAR